MMDKKTVKMLTSFDPDNGKMKVSFDMRDFIELMEHKNAQIERMCNELNSICDQYAPDVKRWWNDE